MNDRTIEDLHAEVDKARHKSRRATAVFGIIVGLVVLSAMTVAGLSSSVAARNGTRIVQLNEDLKDARKAIADATTVDFERDRCERLLQTQVRSASLETQAGVARLVILIATVVPEERDAVLGDEVTRLQAAVDFYDVATTKINTWQLLPSEQQLPCPEGVQPWNPHPPSPLSLTCSAHAPGPSSTCCR